MKPGVPDATAHRPWPSTVNCLTELPWLWDMVMTTYSLYQPPCHLCRVNDCLRGTAAQPGPQVRSRRARERTVFILVLQ
jgi:hypothetical protein